MDGKSQFLVQTIGNGARRSPRWVGGYPNAYELAMARFKRSGRDAVVTIQNQAGELCDAITRQRIRLKVGGSRSIDVTEAVLRHSAHVISCAERRQVAVSASLRGHDLSAAKWSAMDEALHRYFGVSDLRTLTDICVHGAFCRISAEPIRVNSRAI